MHSEVPTPMKMACTPAAAAPSGSFSPILRATIAVVESDSPKPTANTRLSNDSVSPTVATASAPSRPTQNTSTTANSDSSTISRTMGMASSTMARFKLPDVKSWCDPRKASRIDAQKVAGPPEVEFKTNSWESIPSPDISAQARLQIQTLTLAKCNFEKAGVIQVRVSGLEDN